MSLPTTTPSGKRAVRPRPKRSMAHGWMKWRASRPEAEPEEPVPNDKPDRIFQLPPGIK